MSTALILTIGHESYVIAAKPIVAGKLMELLSDAVPCRRDYGFKDPAFREHFRMQPRRPQVTMQMVGRDQIHPPAPEDYEGDDVVELKSLTGAVKLLGPART